MNERIDKYIKNASKIKLGVDVDDDWDEYYGIPVLRSRSLLVFHEICEFQFHGFKVVRLKDIVKIRRSRFETVSQKIMKETGELEKHEIPKWLRIGSFKSLLASLKQRRVCACVASGLEEVNIYRIGEIHSLKEDAVVLNSFDAHGKWHKPKSKIKYSDITEVSFGDEYSVLFNDYVKSRKKQLSGGPPDLSCTR